MNTSPDLMQLVTETRAFAMQLMENAAYIQKQLPELEMPELLRNQIEQLCCDLIGSKHDLIGEAAELHDAYSAGDSPESIIIRSNRIQRWVADDIASINQCVETINEAASNGSTSFVCAMLVMESAANILNATPTFRDFANCEADTEPVEEDENGDDSNTDCYAFHVEDSYPVGQLIDAIRDLLERPDLAADAVEQLRVFLFAMERLPVVTPGVRMGLGLRLDQGGESDWIEIRMEDETFTLGRGSWVDGDADTETVFEVGLGYRDGDAFQAIGFAQSFLSCAEDDCREVVIDDLSDEPFNGWDLEKGKNGWGSLPCSFM